MTNVIRLWIIMPVFGAFMGLHSMQSQENQFAERDQRTGVKGEIELPAQVKQQRVFRGRAYRNRQSSMTNEQPSPAEEQKQKYLNTIISLHPLSFDAPIDKVDPNPQVIQRDATFIPKVTVITEGSTVEFVNDDAFFHNVFSLTKGARFNIGRRPKGDVYPVEIPATDWKIFGMGQISLFCDIHSQMNAVILTLDTPYYTRVYEDGTYSLLDVPEGRYELRMYNPSYDVIRQEVSLGAETLELNLSF